MFEYRAQLIRVVDGDTVLLDLDLGFGTWRRAKRSGSADTSTPGYRLMRIGAPELNEAGGHESRLALESYLAGKSLVAQTQKADSFGRYLVELYADAQNVSDWMVEAGHAVYATY